MRNKKVGNNARLCRFKWSFFKAMTLRREGSCRRFTLDHSPGSRPTLRRFFGKKREVPRRFFLHL